MSRDNLTFNLEPIPPIPDLIRLWRDLFEESDGSFFLSPAWMGSWLNVSKASPYLFRVSRGEADIAAAILNCDLHGFPWMNGRSFHLNSTGDEGEDRIFIEYNDVLLRRDVSQEQRRLVLDGLAKSLKDLSGSRRTFRIKIPRSSMKSESYSSNLIKGKTLSSDTVHYVDLNKVREKTNYLSLLSSNTRYQIRRSERLYRERFSGELVCDRAETFATADTWLNHMAEMQIERWRSAGVVSSFEDPFFRTFAAELCKNAIPNGDIDFLRWRVNDEVIGYILNFLSQNEVLNYQAAFVPNRADNRFKPGLLCHSKTIQRYSNRNFAKYNFLSGEAQYKRSLSTTQEKLYEVQLKCSPENIHDDDQLSAGEGQKETGREFLPRTSALILGDDTRSFLTCVRSLGRQGIDVDVVPTDMRSPALKSRYIRSTYRLPAYRPGNDDWINKTLSLAKEKSYDVVVPCDDRTILLFDKYRDQFSHITKLAIPDSGSISVFYDKVETRHLAQSLNISIAKAADLSLISDAGHLVEYLGLPIALKPKRSYSLDNLQTRNEVVIVRNFDQLRDHLESISNKSNFFAEAYFHGTGVGISVLASNGKVLQSFQHNRINEPGESGGSSLRKSAKINRALEAAVARMVLTTKYSGLAMFEFRLNQETGEWVLLEVNARLWGSVPLPVGLGIDFPYCAARLLFSPGSHQPRQYYETGKKARNSLNDWYDVASTLESSEATRALKVKRLMTWLNHFVLAAANKEINDTFVIDDLRPGFYEFLYLFREKITHTYNQAVSMLPFASYPARASVKRKLGEGDNQDCTITFLCYGNICRSPFAARYLGQLFDKHDVRMHVESAGSMQVENRCSPSAAIDTARSFGVDLQDHRSTFFDQSMAGRTDVLFVFDRPNLNWLKSRYPEMLPRTFYLGHMRSSSDRRCQIFDPYDHPPSFFTKQFDDIKQTLDVLAARLIDS